VIDQNVRASRNVAEQENSGTDCIPKPDALLVLAFNEADNVKPEVRIRSMGPPARVLPTSLGNEDVNILRFLVPQVRHRAFIPSRGCVEATLDPVFC
jgi:hypothetical protein